MLKKSLIAGAAFLAAGATTATAEIGVSGGVDVVSSYVFRGVELTDGGAIQPYVEFSAGGGYFGVWMSKPINDDENVSDETDFYLGYGFDITEGVSADIGVTHYDYPTDLGDTTEAYAGVSFDTILAPSVYVYYDFDLEATTLEGSVGHSFDPIDLGLTVGTVLADDSAFDYTYASVSGTYNFAITEAAGGYIGLNYGTNFDFDTFDGGNEDNAFWVGVGFSVAH